MSDPISKKINRGILTFDFSDRTSNMFVVGIEGGLVVQCSTLGAQPFKGN